MWWRTPWLQQRWLMLSLALGDGLLLLGFYNLLFWHRFGGWAGLTGSIGALILVWLGSSYLLGRYSRPDPGQRDSRRRRLATTLLMGVVVLAAVVVIPQILLEQLLVMAVMEFQAAVAVDIMLAQEYPLRVMVVQV